MQSHRFGARRYVASFLEHIAIVLYVDLDFIATRPGSAQDIAMGLHKLLKVQSHCFGARRYVLGVLEHIATAL